MGRILVAPDSFGDTLTAPAAAAAIARGWARVRPGDDVTQAPQSDGGPGFVDVLSGRLPGAVTHSVPVSGPLGEQTSADYLIADGTAYLECAQACGLSLLPGPPTPQTAWQATSAGVGQLIDDALAHGARRIVVGLGGSSCTDGGAGLVGALGGLEAARTRLEAIELVAATDVEHPLLGSGGAAAVFGPQKGADPDTVARLEARLTAWADELESGTGIPVGDAAGAGAAGGIGAALLALGGVRSSGAQIVAEHTGLDSDIAESDLVITGEGRFDDQTLHGKVVGSIAERAVRTGVPVLVLAGQVTLAEEHWRAAGIGSAASISEFAGSVRLALEDAGNQLTGLAEQRAAAWAGPWTRE